MSGRAFVWPSLLAACFAAFLLAACQPPLCPTPRDGFAATCQVSIAIRHVPVVGPTALDE